MPCENNQLAVAPLVQTVRVWVTRATLGGGEPQAQGVAVAPGVRLQLELAVQADDGDDGQGREREEPAGLSTNPQSKAPPHMTAEPAGPTQPVEPARREAELAMEGQQETVVDNSTPAPLPESFTAAEQGVVSAAANHIEHGTPTQAHSPTKVQDQGMGLQCATTHPTKMPQPDQSATNGRSEASAPSEGRAGWAGREASS